MRDRKRFEIEKDNQLTKVYLPGGVLFFSYTTLIGVYDYKTYRLALNQWSRTTGKHLASIRKGTIKEVLDLPIEEIHVYLQDTWANIMEIDENNNIGQVA